MIASTGKSCAKCGYTRTELDTGSDWQCPNCGVAYVKAAALAGQAVEPPTARPRVASASASPEMTFGSAITTCLQNFANFSGRAGRPEYWWFILFWFLLLVVGGIVNEFLGTLFFILLLLPNLAVSVRRLHDIGKSGWWLAISLIPVIGPLILLYWAIQPSDGFNEYG